MIYRADLHTHSTASDGQYTPSELVRLAKGQGIEVLALTDHDTLDGLEEAVRAGRELNLRVLRGVELSAREYDTFHILGYGFSAEDFALSVLCRRMKERRKERNPRLLQFLKERGVVLSLAEIEEVAGGDIIGRPHFAQAMVQRGYVASNREAFDRYLDTKEYYRQIDQGKPPVRDCIEAIKAAGGKVSLAHPYQIGLDNETLEALVKELAGYGLDAIECYYPRYTPQQQTLYLHLVEKFGLHITGGSDFHGERVKSDIQLAAWQLELEWLLV